MSLWYRFSRLRNVMKFPTKTFKFKQKSLLLKENEQAHIIIMKVV